MATKKPAPKKAAPAKKAVAKPAPAKAATKPAPKKAAAPAKPAPKKAPAKPAPKKAAPAKTASKPVKAAPKKAPAKPAAKKAVPAKPAPKPVKKAPAPAPAKPAPKKAAPAPAKKAAPVKTPPAPVKAAPVKPVAAPPPPPPVKKTPPPPPAKPVKKQPEPIKEVKVPKTSVKTSVPYKPGYTPLEKRVETTRSNGPLVKYSDADLNEFRELINKKLEAAKKELAYLQGLITRKDEMGGDNDDARYMTMEDGSMSMEREQLSQMASRQITYIDHLEKAIMRIENKTYGICRVTGKLIDKARLRAVPHATLSLEAKLGLVKPSPEQ